MKSKHAVSKPTFLVTITLIVVLGSMAVIADTIATSNATNNTSAQDTLLAGNITDNTSLVPAPNGTITVAYNLSTPIQAVETCTPGNGCAASAYIINNHEVINLTDPTYNVTLYNCTLTDNGKVYLTCDSNYDGNGDGICQSGETCIQYGIVGDFITVKERNSQDNWKDADPSVVISTPAVQSLTPVTP